jgi:hypothetical protein
MLAFAETIGNRGRLLLYPSFATRSRIRANAHVWAVRTRRSLRVLVVNKELRRSGVVRIRIPGARRSGAVVRLQGPSAAALTGVTWAGQAVASPTTTGLLEGNRISETIRPRRGIYSFQMPRTSAALLVVQR